MNDPRFPLSDGRVNAWDPGTQYMPPGPHNRPRRIPGQLYFPGGGSIADVVYVREVNRYPLLQTLSFVLAVADVLAVAQADTTRIVIGIRNISTSANNVLVSFGQAASQATALFEIVAGGVVYLDYVVPQDDVHVTSLGTATCVVSYANSNL